MKDYNITVGPLRAFICAYPEPHEGPCVLSTFVHGTPTTTADPTTVPPLPTELPLPTTEETLP